MGAACCVFWLCGHPAASALGHEARPETGRDEARPQTVGFVEAGPPEDDPLANRDRENRSDTQKKFGGDKKTERAVADGLAWLAAHQRPDGVWDRMGFDRLCPPDDRCSQTALAREQKGCNVGVSALAALAFLGAGYTHEEGPYRETLEKAFEYILAQQDVTGSFSSGSGLQMYNDAIATLAIAEALALTQDRVFVEPLKRAVRHLGRAQQTGGGWDYTVEAQTGRNDTSVTGWVVMALKAAQAAGAGAPLETRFRLVEHFDRATESDGRVWYANKGTGTEYNPATGLHTLRYGPAMTAIALYARGALGFRLDDRLARSQSDLLARDLPDLTRLRGGDPTGLHGEYYWYYGTLAMFNLGGEAWQRWNQALRRTVLEYQERPTRKNGRRRHAYGSWPAFGRGWGKWGRTGSRIYSTAINTLTLEVYYRYVPAYLSPRGLIGPGEMRRRIAMLGPMHDAEMLAITADLHADTAEPVLLDFLESLDAAVRLEAAIELATLGSPFGKAALSRLRETAKARDVQRIDAALKAFVEPPSTVSYGQVTEINSQARMFLFDTGGRPLYYRQWVRVLRKGRRIAGARVNRRFSVQKAAAAVVLEGTDRVKVGDIVVSGQEKDGS
jgi:hypothetical protein